MQMRAFFSHVAHAIHKLHSTIAKNILISAQKKTL